MLFLHFLNNRMGKYNNMRERERERESVCVIICYVIVMAYLLLYSSSPYDPSSSSSMPTQPNIYNPGAAPSYEGKATQPTGMYPSANGGPSNQPQPYLYTPVSSTTPGNKGTFNQP